MSRRGIFLADKSCPEDEEKEVRTVVGCDPNFNYLPSFLLVLLGLRPKAEEEGKKKNCRDVLAFIIGMQFPSPSPLFALPASFVARGLSGAEMPPLFFVVPFLAL